MMLFNQGVGRISEHQYFVNNVTICAKHKINLKGRHVCFPNSHNYWNSAQTYQENLCWVIFLSRDVVINKNTNTFSSPLWFYLHIHNTWPGHIFHYIMINLLGSFMIILGIKRQKFPYLLPPQLFSKQPFKPEQPMYSTVTSLPCS